MNTVIKGRGNVATERSGGDNTGAGAGEEIENGHL